jgi:hypothetical protein
MSSADDRRHTAPPPGQTADPGIDTAVGVQHLRGEVAEIADEGKQITSLGIFGKPERLSFQPETLGFG